jgi:hypothetical protein
MMMSEMNVGATVSVDTDDSKDSDTESFLDAEAPPGPSGGFRRSGNRRGFTLDREGGRKPKGFKHRNVRADKE